MGNGFDWANIPEQWDERNINQNTGKLSVASLVEHLLSLQQSPKVVFQHQTTKNPFLLLQALSRVVNTSVGVEAFRGVEVSSRPFVINKTNLCLVDYMKL